MKAAIRDIWWMLQNFYPHLLAFHGLLRWVVLAAAVAAIFVAIPGWSGTKPASGTLLRFGIIFVAAMDTPTIPRMSPIGKNNRNGSSQKS